MVDNPFKGLGKGEKIAVAVGGAAVFYFVYKQHKASSATAAATAGASAIDPLTGLPASQDNVTDPLTGETYLGEAQQYGSVAAAEQALSGQGITGYSGYSAYGYTGQGGSYVPANVTQAATYGSNAAWAQAAEAGLTDLGYSATDVGAALGRYLGGLSLSSAQATIVQTALAEYGTPPTGNPQMILQGTAPTGSGSPQVTVPDLVGQEQEAAFAIDTAAGLHTTGTPVIHGKILYVVSQDPAAGTRVAQGSTVHVTSKVR